MRRTGHVRAWLAIASASALVASCSAKTATEIVVRVDSDLEIPTEIDALTLRVQDSRVALDLGVGERDGGSGPGLLLEKHWNLQQGFENTLWLPATIGLLPGSEQRVPIEITAIGRVWKDKRSRLFARRARLPFAEERVVLLRLNLLRSCLDTVCPPDQTCGENGCEPVAKDPQQLPNAGADTGPRLETSAVHDSGAAREASPSDQIASGEASGRVIAVGKNATCANPIEVDLSQGPVTVSANVAGAADGTTVCHLPGTSYVVIRSTRPVAKWICTRAVGCGSVTLATGPACPPSTFAMAAACPEAWLPWLSSPPWYAAICARLNCVVDVRLEPPP